MKKTNLKSELKKPGKTLEIEFNNVKALHQKSDFIIMTFDLLKSKVTRATGYLVWKCVSMM